MFWQIYQVSGDLPEKLVQVCSSTIAVPATIIFNQITKNVEYPRAWRIEHQVALGKVPSLEKLDKIINIANISEQILWVICRWVAHTNNQALPGSWTVWLTERFFNHWLSKQAAPLCSCPTGPQAAPWCLGCLYRPQQGLQPGGPLAGQTGPAWYAAYASMASESSDIISVWQVNVSVIQWGKIYSYGAYLGGLIFIVKYV